MKRLAIAANIIFFTIGLLSVPLAMTAPMIFDAPGAVNNTYLWIAFWSALALPLTCLVSIIFSSYILYRKNNPRKAFFIALIPLIIIVIFCWSMLMIQFYCGGNFSCHGGG